MIKKQLGSRYDPKKVRQVMVLPSQTWPTGDRCVPFCVSTLLPRAFQGQGTMGDMGIDGDKPSALRLFPSV